jgi:hypothetical protein
VGHVTEVRSRGKRPDAAPANNGSRLGLVFDKAVFDDGRQVPVVATIRAVASSDAASADAARSADGARGAAFGSGRLASGGSGSGLHPDATGPASDVLRGVGSLGGAAADDVPSSTNSGAPRVSGGAAGAARGGVLISHATNVELPRGTRMLLISG